MSKRHFATLLFFISLFPAQCQFTSLAANRDGSRIYFVSRLRQAGSGQPPYGKLFVADAAGIRPLLIRSREVIPEKGTDTEGLYRTNAYDILGADVPWDVSRLAVVARSDCRTIAVVCNPLDFATTTVYGSSGVGTDFQGRGRLSPDGVWLSLITFPDRFFGIGDTAASVTNLNGTASSRFFFPTLNSGYQNGAIANNGRFAFGGGAEGVSTVIPGGSIVTLARQGDAARLDATGNTVVWTQLREGRQAVMIATAADFMPRLLLSSSGDATAQSVSSDGATVLLIAMSATKTQQVFLIRSDGSGLVQVTHEETGVTAALLTGDGQTVIATSGDGSLLRIGLVSGRRDLLIGPTLSLSSGALAETVVQGTEIQSALASLPGSAGEIVHLTGTDLNGATVQVNGIPAAVTGNTANSLDFQVPWQTAASQSATAFSVTIPGLQSGLQSNWIGGGEGILAPDAQWVAVAHQDFLSLVTSASPAHPGEIVNVYAKGFGPVSNPPAPGQPTPDVPLSPLIAPLTLTLEKPGSQTTTPEVLFAGLAPGTVGYYQVSLRLPTSLTAGEWLLATPLTPGALQIPVLP